MKPLRGQRIVEVATYVAAPSGALALARLGADVVRVDPLGGASDHHRWPVAPNGGSLYWTGLNKGKRSVIVDLRSPRGQELVTALVAERGTLLDNTVGWDWLAHDRLTARRPDLVHVRVQGRPDGAPALDYTANAAAGVPSVTGPAGEDGPVNHQLPAWDLLTGAHAANAVLAGLLHRATTGEGVYAEIALSDVALGAVADLGWLGEAQLKNVDRPKQGNHIYGSFGTALRTADGEYVMVVAMTGRQWRALREATGTTEAMARLATTSGLDLDVEENRYRLREEIAAELARWFAERDLETVAKTFDGTRVLWQPYRSLSGLAREPGEALLGEIDQPGIGPVLAARGAVRWPGSTVEEIVPAPVLGAHTHEVLAGELGLSHKEIGALVDEGVIQR
ncbi:2-methylfumaryl-CoA isomerase [Amycolatopsis sp. K13G38]|uniref:2-methylfumaryl-CoA isomerase n=1 Tax=Amycolatopsis acididurans TaxID=2724524 RepID=A0ABX1IWC8_9PSEU|nr:CoA transferase [Amycolatopsis acididurans]NKQ51777.1 2-methylfumaryl-CoA isomerase [Amycolatopsis acididurans]